MTQWHEISTNTVDVLVEAGLDPQTVVSRIVTALEEDLDGGDDVTTVATIPPESRGILELVAHKPGVVAGVPVVAAVCETVGGAQTDVAAIVRDGGAVDNGDVIVQVAGDTRSLLTAERTALNFLGHLSGIATATADWVAALGDRGTRVRDTRKTTPGLRALEKYAVRQGGGLNHRMSLSDAALVKDNHVAASGGVAAAFEAVRHRYPHLPVEVEVDDLAQLEQVVEAGADLILLDNFTTAEMRQAVQLVDGRARLEASGGLTLLDAAEVAATGVDYVAVGAITHSAASLDIGADLSVVPPDEAGDREPVGSL